VIRELVASWAGQHGAEALDKGEGMQAHAVDAVAKSPLEEKEDVAVCHDAQTALGDRRSGNIAGEAFAGRGRAGSDGRDPDLEGSISAIKRRCMALRKARAPQPEEVAISVACEPGDIAQVDFGYVGKLYDPEQGQPRKPWVFVMVLGHSRLMAARFVFDQKVSTWLRVHDECLREFGGAPKNDRPGQS
jgi:hypothetical protein